MTDGVQARGAPAQIKAIKDDLSPLGPGAAPQARRGWCLQPGEWGTEFHAAPRISGKGCWSR
ncbi:hypothetical protein NBRC116598_06670 [Pseudophaeobacter arcticus]|uniref:Uncharacterized protein n=1 Tax=Pseudophaeobacter arcticus TaxID=385492 RepID=A0ABQ0AH88_9RHOB